MPIPENAPTVGNLPELSLQDIASLLPELLAILQGEIGERLQRDKAAKARLSDALSVRYAAQAAQQRQVAEGHRDGPLRGR